MDRDIIWVGDDDMEIDVWRILSWICIVYAFIMDYLPLSENLIRGIAGICFIYIVGYSVYDMRNLIKKKRKL